MKAGWQNHLKPSLYVLRRRPPPTAAAQGARLEKD